MLPIKGDFYAMQGVARTRGGHLVFAKPSGISDDVAPALQGWRYGSGLAEEGVEVGEHFGESHCWKPMILRAILPRRSMM